jgi:squalene-hopene/tetraprenyl-beta-curcumene cyclase
LSRAASYLLARQSKDGAWRSDTYGAFKDGTALTPLALRALAYAPKTPEIEAGRAKGTAFLVKLIQSDDPELSYPLYTATNAILVLDRPDEAKARSAWVKYLRGRQLTEALDWSPEDKEYGGWGYCIVEPRKPQPGKFAPALTESNLSATLFALEALRAAGVKSDDPSMSKALVFVRRCQNFADDPNVADANFDDGGFHFIYDDPVRNKAGVAGKDAHGRERFFSYGSVTADGLRSLFYCGLKSDDPCVRAARGWLVKQFSAERHPGTYVKQFENHRMAVYYYYSASVSQAWRLLAAEGIKGPDRWAEALARELMKRQQDDGFWVNPVDTVRENDEVTATCFAMIALGNCRSALAD